MQFSKISVTEGKVHLVRETKRDGTVESIDLESPDAPLPSFRDSLQGFVGYVVTLIPFLEPVRESLTITTLNLSEDKNGLRGLIVTAITPVEKAYQKPLVLNTPLVRQGGEDPSPEAFVLTKEVLKLIEGAEAEARRYVKGEREQLDAFRDGESENAKEADTKMREASTASTRKPRASKNGKKASDTKKPSAKDRETIGAAERGD